MPASVPAQPDVEAPSARVSVRLEPVAAEWSGRVPPDGAFRAVPLLLVLGDPADLVVVGRVHVRQDGPDVTVDAVIDGVWVTVDGGWEPAGPAEPRDVDVRIQRALREVRVDAPAEVLADPQGAVARFAKSLAEGSRGAVARLRALRYAVESGLADQLRPGRRDSVLPALATLLELGVMSGRAADQAREAVREGLWVWLTDPEAYHSYRVTQDPTILSGHAPADHATRPWMRTHDATVRQCRAMEEQLTAEADVISSLLDAAATVASARESESQQLFNTLVGVAAVGLGLPALVLSLYGADQLVPLTSLRQVLALLPIALAAGLAGVVAVRQLPAGSTRKHVAGTVLVVLALLLFLVFAGVVAPGGGG